LTDDEKNQVKTNVTNANKDKFPAGTEVTVGDDGTATITYSDGSKDTIPGRDLIIGAKGEGISGNTAKSGSKNNSLKTLPQTGNGANEKASALGFLFAGLASIFSLAGRRKKKY
ncbi:LPXTG cell wall anchor domain-containing protein, partial [Limosilactobacillus reuteri]